MWIPWRHQQPKRLDAAKILTVPALQQPIQHIQQLTGVTQADFKALYSTTIQRFSEFLTPANQVLDAASLHEHFETVILALKRRQGVLLPVGADSEVVFREREIWTFAIFSAALFQALQPALRFPLAKALLPAPAFAWLHRHPDVFEAWRRFLVGETAQNVLTSIVTGLPCSRKQKATVIATPNTLPSPLELKQPVIAENKRTLTAAPEIKTDTAKPNAPVQAPLRGLEKKMIQEVDLDALMPQATHEEKKPLVQPVVDAPRYTAKEVCPWITQGLLEQTISVNQRDSVIHRVEAGIFVLIPAAITLFLRQKMNNPGSQPHPQQASLIQGFKKHPALISHAQGARIQTYCWGDWQERQLLHGVVLHVDAFGEAAHSLPLNEHLNPDPLRDTVRNTRN